MCGRCAVSFGGSGIPAARPFSGTIPRCQRLSASPAAEPRAENIGLRARRQRALRVQLGENSPGLQQQLRQMPDASKIGMLLQAELRVQSQPAAGGRWGRPWGRRTLVDLEATYRQRNET